MRIWKIIVTGGPAAGKSTLISKIPERLASLGYNHCFVISEVATELMESGLVYKDDPIAFQTAVLKLQLAKEAIVEKYIADTVGDDEVAIILADRGARDGSSFLSNHLWRALLEAEGLTEDSLESRYDAVIHLETSALLDDDTYGNETNRFRSEDRADAIIQNLHLKLLYQYHENVHYAVVPACESFQEKESLFFDKLASLLTEMT